MTRKEVKEACERVPPAELKQASLPEAPLQLSAIGPRVPFWIASVYLRVEQGGSTRRVLVTVNGVETSSEIFKTADDRIFAVFVGFPGQKSTVRVAVILNE